MEKIIGTNYATRAIFLSLFLVIYITFFRSSNSYVNNKIYIKSQSKIVLSGFSFKDDNVFNKMIRPGLLKELHNLMSEKFPALQITVIESENEINDIELSNIDYLFIGEINEFNITNFYGWDKDNLFMTIAASILGKNTKKDEDIYNPYIKYICELRCKIKLIDIKTQGVVWEKQIFLRESKYKYIKEGGLVILNERKDPFPPLPQVSIPKVDSELLKNVGDNFVKKIIDNFKKDIEIK